MPFYVHRLQTNTGRQSAMVLANGIIARAQNNPVFGGNPANFGKLAQQFITNAQGTLTDLDKTSSELMKGNNKWVIISDDNDQPCILAKYHKSDRGSVDLSEVVKHPDTQANALPTLFKWAYFHERDGENSTLTLTAATKKLIEIYEGYGFVRDGGGRPLPPGDGFTQVNLPMKMGTPSSDVLSAVYRIIPQ